MSGIRTKACVKPECDNFGKRGQNIGGHGWFTTKTGRKRRYPCKICGTTASTNTGTAYAGLGRTGQTKALFGQVPQYRSGRRGLTALWTAGQASEGGDLRYMFCSRRRARGQTGAMALSVAREDAGRRRQ